MLKLQNRLCTGCRICEMICSLTHEGEIAPRRSRIKVLSDWPKEETIQVCVACRPKKCIEACPQEALHWKETLQLREERCDLCGACAGACPFGGIRMDSPGRYPHFCDRCGGAYECVRWCPPKALARVGDEN